MKLKRKQRQHLKPLIHEKVIDVKRFINHEVDWYLNPKSWVSKSRLRTYKNLHLGDRCFILGNGPSLKKTNLSLLKNEYTFGLNRIYLLFDQLGFSTTYFVAVNHLVIEQCADEIFQVVHCPKFIDWKARKFLAFTKDMMLLRHYPQEPRFFNNIEQGVWQGTTVTYVAMQIAFYMGFSQVILVGVDHSFATKGTPHKIVVTDDQDPNILTTSILAKVFGGNCQTWMDRNWPIVWPNINMSAKGVKLLMLQWMVNYKYFAKSISILCFKLRLM